MERLERGEMIGNNWKGQGEDEEETRRKWSNREMWAGVGRRRKYALSVSLQYPLLQCQPASAEMFGIGIFPGTTQTHRKTYALADTHIQVAACLMRTPSMFLSVGAKSKQD